MSHPKHQARVGAHRIDLHPAEDAQRPQIPLGLGHQSGVVQLAWPQENLAAYHRRAGLEVERVAQSSQPSFAHWGRKYPAESARTRWIISAESTSAESTDVAESTLVGRKG